MPRQARKKSSTGIYHVMLRGINKQNIFQDDKDRQQFVETIARYKDELHFSLYAYCLMDNHVHMLIKENLQSTQGKIDDLPFAPVTVPTIELIIKKIAVSYVVKYNKKYGRTGHLFQDRYRSEPIENERYFLSAVRYVHQNPVRAGLTETCDYYWSSYNELLSMFNKTENIWRVEEHDISAYQKPFLSKYIDNYFNKDSYVEFMHAINDEKFLDIETGVRLTDREVINLIKKTGLLGNVEEIKHLDTQAKQRIISEVKAIEGVNTLQLARITGETRYFIDRSGG